jgi:hypothetical protein
MRPLKITEWVEQATTACSISNHCASPHDEDVSSERTAVDE